MMQDVRQESYQEPDCSNECVPHSPQSVTPGRPCIQALVIQVRGVAHGPSVGEHPVFFGPSRRAGPQLQ